MEFSGILKPFSKKTDTIVLVLSLLCIAAGTVLVAMSGTLLGLIQNILENYVFHRTFNLEKWSDTITALIAFPIFIAIFFDSVLFVKFSSPSKFVVIASFFFVSAFLLVFAAATVGSNTMDSDMASEILLAKEGWASKTFWPRIWNYSTEFRLLNTQLLTVPLFAFTDNWVIIKTLSAFLNLLLVPLLLFFILGQLEIKNFWLKAILCLLAFVPWSGRSWQVIQFGSYYIPHVVLSWVFIGGFIWILKNEGKTEKSGSKKIKIIRILFWVLSFISGLSSIRYILQFVLPLFIVMISLEVGKIVAEKREFRIKEVFIENRGIFYSFAALVLSGIGYISNSLVLSKLYSFANFNTMKFNNFNEVPLMQWIGGYFSVCGYQNNVSVFTPSGICNVLVFVFFSFAILSVVSYLKSEKGENSEYGFDFKRIFVLYSVVVLVFNTFVFVNTDYYGRYLVTIILAVFPIFAIIVESEKVSLIKRSILILSMSILMLTVSFTVYSKIFSNELVIIDSRNNTERIEIAKFLVDEGYTFGYAKFWETNVYSYLTNDKIEMADIGYKKQPWLTTKRYYADDYKAGEKVFLILTNAQIEKYPDVVKIPDEVDGARFIYNGENYSILHFNSNKDFKKIWTIELINNLEIK